MTSRPCSAGGSRAAGRSCGSSFGRCRSRSLMIRPISRPSSTLISTHVAMPSTTQSATLTNTLRLPLTTRCARLRRRVRLGEVERYGGYPSHRSTPVVCTRWVAFRGAAMADLAGPPAPPPAGGRGGATPLVARALAPDLARGVMLLLIALANAHLFLYGQPLGLRGYPADLAPVDRTVAVAQLLLVDGRAYPLFALLFGYGIVQLARRQEAAGRDVGSVVVARAAARRVADADRFRARGTALRRRHHRRVRAASGGDGECAGRRLGPASCCGSASSAWRSPRCWACCRRCRHRRG